MDVDQSPCLYILARTQCRERERGQEDVDQSPCLSLLARIQAGEREWGHREEGILEEGNDTKQLADEGNPNNGNLDAKHMKVEVQHVTTKTSLPACQS